MNIFPACLITMRKDTFDAKVMNKRINHVRGKPEIEEPVVLDTGNLLEDPQPNKQQHRMKISEVAFLEIEQVLTG